MPFTCRLAFRYSLTSARVPLEVMKNTRLNETVMVGNDFTTDVTLLPKYRDEVSWPTSHILMLNFERRIRQCARDSRYSGLQEDWEISSMWEARVASFSWKCDRAGFGNFGFHGILWKINLNKEIKILTKLSKCNSEYVYESPECAYEWNEVEEEEGVWRLITETIGWWRYGDLDQRFESEGCTERFETKVRAWKISVSGDHNIGVRLMLWCNVKSEFCEEDSRTVHKLIELF